MVGVLVFVIGASVGSFLNLAADRIPAGRSIVRPRSSCEDCGRRLGSLDLVPVLSYLWLRGRCRYCGSKIPLRLMMVEAVMGLLFAAIYSSYGLDAEFVVLGAAVSLMMVVALIDLEHRLILNRMMLPSIAVLVALAPFWTELGLTRPFLGSENMVASLLNSVSAGLGLFLLFLVMVLVYPKGMGGGDVKLAGVIGLLVGYPGALVALWLAVVSGGLTAIGLLALRKAGRKDAMPFGPFLALGAIAGLLIGSDMVSWYHDLGNYLAGW